MIPENPQYIETVLGKGYRGFKGRTALYPAGGAGTVSIMPAVLPFENLSGDPAQVMACADELKRGDDRALGQMSPRRLG